LARLPADLVRRVTQRAITRQRRNNNDIAWSCGWTILIFKLPKLRKTQQKEQDEHNDRNTGVTLRSPSPAVYFLRNCGGDFECRGFCGAFSFFAFFFFSRLFL
jgi:hypothetical protein